MSDGEKRLSKYQYTKNDVDGNKRNKMTLYKKL